MDTNATPGPDWVLPDDTSGATDAVDPAPNAGRSRRGIGAAVAFVIAGAVGGAAIAHETWRPSNVATASVAPTTNGSTLPTRPGGATGGPPGSTFGGTNDNGSGSPGAGTGGPSDAAAIAKDVDPGVVDITTTIGYQDARAAGTGMVLTSTGEVLTNNHVIDGATSISVTDVGNGKTYTATVVGYDTTADIAVLQLNNASGLSTVKTATATAQVGAGVVGIGNAGGNGGTPSYAGGVITAVDQAITAGDSSDGSSERLTGLLEINADIIAGDSGGPLVDEQGDVIGMDTAASAGYQFSNSSEAFAIPIETATQIAGQIESGDASTTVHIGATAMLGVGVATTADNGFGGSAATPSSGATVAQVVAGGPAAKAGIISGDTIVAVAGRPVTSAATLGDVIRQESPGTTVTVRYLSSSGTSHTASVQLTSGPPQ